MNPLKRLAFAISVTKAESSHDKVFSGWGFAQSNQALPRLMVSALQSCFFWAFMSAPAISFVV